MKIAVCIGMAAAGILRAQPNLSFYHDTDSLGLRTALILAACQAVTGFVTSRPQLRGGYWPIIMTGAGPDFLLPS